MSNNIEETLMTFIKNRIHYSDNLNRPMYSQNILKKSVRRMIPYLIISVIEIVYFQTHKLRF